MADDNTLRPYRSNDPYRRAVEPSRSSDPGAGDPLAELARLIGQSDPFAEFGRGNPRQVQQETHAQHGGLRAPARDDWQYDATREQQPVPDYSRATSREPYLPSGDYGYPPAHEPRAEGWHPDSYRHDEMRPEPDYRGQPYADDQTHDSAQHHGHEADQSQDDHYYQDDAPLAPHEDEMYDDAPRKRHHSGLATALALIGCAMLGTAGAYAYRSYYAPSGATQPPPVITADSSTPTKIVPTAPAPADPQSNKAIQDRVATAGREQIVTKQEEPIALKELGTQAAPRVVLPAPVAPAPSGSPSQPSGPAAAAGASGEAKRVRTVTIRPDGTDVSGRPVGLPPPTGRSPDATATARPTTTPPAPKATAPATAPARGGGSPLSLDPQTGEPAAAAPARTAAVPPARSAAEPSSTPSGYVVQLSSQKSESDAQAVFRSLQAKFPNELGDRKPIVRRADLGSKGVFYRTMVGPFSSSQEAAKFCASYKAAGGQCVVPNN
jgi:sporulation related protein